MARLSGILGTMDPPKRLQEMAIAGGATTALSDIGLGLADIDIVADHVLAAPYANPRAVTRGSLADLLYRVATGAPATADPDQRKD
jgi:maleylacetate reductase